MKINLKFKAMAMLKAELQETQMWAIYQMTSGEDIPEFVTKTDLVKILAFLFKKLDWIEEIGGQSEATSQSEEDAFVKNEFPNDDTSSIGTFDQNSSEIELGCQENLSADVLAAKAQLFEASEDSIEDTAPSSHAKTGALVKS